jgi:hypothetical protein
MGASEAQSLIHQVRLSISKEDYSQALALLRGAPADRAAWTPQEKDEVICLEEFLENLKSPLRV